jgi:tetratricopeptide (TPR) repeat protein
MPGLDAKRRYGRYVAMVVAVIACVTTSGRAQVTPRTDMPGMSMPATSPASTPFPQTIDDWARGAVLFDGLGLYHRPITTRSAEAQAFFDQGMRWMYGFNHDEAARSFARATQFDPQCALCFWGLALTLGPNYNMPTMAEPRARVAWEALGKAQLAAPGATPAERALIEALSHRYVGPNALDPGNEMPQLTAYSAAMRTVMQHFPDDPDVATLFAESAMNLNAWKLWDKDGKPAPGTLEIVATLEHVLARHPDHPGANHYYIHAVEASPHPERAVVSADRLKAMAPAAGHLVHMPSHIFQRVGRYEEAAKANRLGAAADVAYSDRVRPIDYYPMYLAHNYQFLAFAAAMEGRRAETIAALRSARGAISDDALVGMPGVDWYIAFLYLGMVRFGMWDDILAEPAPDHRLLALNVGYLGARTMALAARGRIEEARASELALDQLVSTAPPDAQAGLNSARDIFAIVEIVAQARIAAAIGDRAGNVALLTQAVAAEDRLSYDEPADNFFPTRHLLGAALLDAGDPVRAEAVYREDLRRNPANGWALVGLSSALAALHRRPQAEAARRDAATAWTHADIPLGRSAF